MNKIAIVSGILLAAGATFNVQAHPINEGYVTTSTDTIWRTSNGECWRHGFWKQDNAVKGCADYVEPVATAPAPAPKPAPAPVIKDVQVSQNHVVYFDFDSSVVKSVDAITAYISGLTRLVGVTLSGHADLIGSNDYNMALSKKRVDAVADALAANGVDRNLITTEYAGEDKPVKTCAKATKACLAENRRVEVTVNGIKQVKQ